MKTKATLFLFAIGMAAAIAPVAGADLQVSFADSGWNGSKVPGGQQCAKFGGNGATPAMKVSGIPDGTTAILVEFNDASYQPLSRKGGHGIVGFEHAGGADAMLAPVPGGTDQTPSGTWIEKKNRATGAWESPGYLPPCSGGRGNFYFAVVKAVDAGKKTLAKGEIDLGKY